MAPSHDPPQSRGAVWDTVGPILGPFFTGLKQLNEDATPGLSARVLSTRDSESDEAEDSDGPEPPRAPPSTPAPPSAPAAPKPPVEPPVPLPIDKLPVKLPIGKRGSVGDAIGVPLPIRRNSPNTPAQRRAEGFELPKHPLL